MIEVKTVTVGTQVTYATSKTFTHVNNGASVLLRVCISPETTFPSGVTATYGGTSMTMAGYYTTATDYILFFILFTAASGSNSVVVSWTNNAKGGFIATSLNGVSGYRTVGSGYGGGGSATVSTTATTNPGDVVFDAAMVASGATATVGAGQAEEYNTTVSTIRILGSNEAAPGNSLTMTWTLSVSKTWASAALPLYGYRSAGVGISPTYEI